ncbi:conserved phage C-terminal domain-containing protein [Liquorilactobacillus mali]|uniref:conserved phage C-terminal domain-containing protein n=1 Tax=Liquorilactobacillus mali TaxID=1618 RepID=UPI002350C86C|nr:conserved phage C-terminal domain-containing protein [Liquorilactobacillus mali]MDC7953216.1 conserved phage C-terminal domain-containing protein [Liquorilactobacillus mali]
MADNKKYYYLKLKDNFFESDELKMLQSYSIGKNEGYVYSDILLKMYLKSLKNDGALLFKGMIPYSPEMLSTVTNHGIGEVKDALNKFESLGLITKIDNGVIFMNDIQHFVGQSSTEADRIRAYRSKLDNAKKIDDVQMYDKSTPEFRDKSLEIRDKNKTYSPAKAEPHLPYQEIIDYLNEKAGTSYRATTKKTQTLIKARFNEKFSLDDFKQVIDNKVAEWKNDTAMNKFLRPETLFGTKFEGYLNQEKTSKGNTPTGKEWF